MTTKVLALTDALGNLVRFVLLPGQRHDTVGLPPLIDGVRRLSGISCGAAIVDPKEVPDGPTQSSLHP
jgi:putative hemolysin